MRKPKWRNVGLHGSVQRQVKAVPLRMMTAEMDQAHTADGTHGENFRGTPALAPSFAQPGRGTVEESR